MITHAMMSTQAAALVVMRLGLKRGRSNKVHRFKEDEPAQIKQIQERGIF